jgi:hypothetical protein
MEQLQAQLLRLITDTCYRLELSGMCRESVQRTSGNPQQMVRSCEELYLSLVQGKTGGNLSESDFKPLLPPLPLPERILNRLRNACRKLRPLRREQP